MGGLSPVSVEDSSSFFSRLLHVKICRPRFCGDDQQATWKTYTKIASEKKRHLLFVANIFGNTKTAIFFVSMRRGKCLQKDLFVSEASGLKLPSKTEHAHRSLLTSKEAEDYLYARESNGK